MKLETDRTRLRIFRHDDIDDLAAILAKPQVMKYLGLKGEPMTKAETGTAMLSMIAHWKRRNFGRWAVISKESGKLIGCAGLRSYEDAAELVYLIDEPFWGKGLATEIAAASLDFGFNNHEFKKIIALTRPKNLASRRVMEKIGMSYARKSKIFGFFVVEYAITRQTFISANLSRSASFRQSKFICA